ncbi:MAG: hypothetical protein J1F66_04310 [Clostridiales bacterium]|nr:hypothetical protein [Clostridiales bacterium]
MEYGKFNSAEELLKGYESLEKSFTQKCQQLSALERKLNESGTNGEPSPQQNFGQSVANDTVDTVPEATNADSLEPHNQRPTDKVIPPRVMTGGGNVSCALPNRPKTLKEASELAKKYFK